MRIDSALMDTRASRVRRVCAGAAFLVMALVPALWLFNKDPEPRRMAILLALGCALACVILLFVQQRRAGGWRPFKEIVAAEFSEMGEGALEAGPDLPDVPRLLPSRRGQQQRAILWGVGVCTAIVGVVALGVGEPQRSSLVQRLHDSGAEFAWVQAEKVSDVRQLSRTGRDPYVATVVVQLPGAASTSPVSATVKTETYERPRPGDEVQVLYAPSQPNLGAVAGDERRLGPELRGETMPAYMRWGLVVLWALGVLAVLNDVHRRHGFRAFSRMNQTDRAIRGQYTRMGQYHHDEAGGRGEPAKGRYLEVHTGSGWVHFLTEIDEPGPPEALRGQRLWLCWDASRGTRGGRLSVKRTPAALVFDSGWVMHGMLNVNKAMALRTAGVSVGKMDGPAERTHPLRVWDPRAKWLLSTSATLFGCYVVTAACAGLLTFDLAPGWRWAVAITGLLSVLVGANPHFNLAPDAVESGGK